MRVRSNLSIIEQHSPLVNTYIHTHIHNAQWNATFLDLYDIIPHGIVPLVSAHTLILVNNIKQAPLTTRIYLLLSFSFRVFLSISLCSGVLVCVCAFFLLTIGYRPNRRDFSFFRLVLSLLFLCSLVFMQSYICKATD